MRYDMPVPTQGLELVRLELETTKAVEAMEELPSSMEWGGFTRPQFHYRFMHVRSISLVPITRFATE